MTESSILSTTRQKYINPQETQHSDRNINQHTLRELMIINDQILNKWQQSTPGIERLLHDLKGTVLAINQMMNKMNVFQNQNLFIKYSNKLNNLKNINIKQNIQTLRGADETAGSRKAVVTGRYQGDYRPVSDSTQTAGSKTTAQSRTNDDTQVQNIAHKNPEMNAYENEYAIKNIYVYPIKLKDVRNIEQNIQNVKSGEGTVENNKEVVTGRYQGDYRPVSDSTQAAESKTTAQSSTNDDTQVQNIAQNVHYRNSQIVKQDEQQYVKGINSLQENVYNRISQVNTVSPQAQIQHHATFFRNADSSGVNTNTGSSINFKMQFQNFSVGARPTPEVIPNIIDLLMVSQLGRIGAYDTQLLTSYDLIQARNNLLTEIQQMISLARVNKPSGSNTNTLPEEVIDFMAAQGLAVPAKDKQLTADEYEGYIESMNTLLTQYNSESQLELLKLQRVISYRNQAFETISNTLSRILRARDTIIGNIR